ncbi:MAG TPA: NifU family protein, partial [Candidatus Angelobacter sp.]|nr:NifU family protein [Candidatus Angelobacter sp.]
RSYAKGLKEWGRLRRLRSRLFQRSSVVNEKDFRERVQQMAELAADLEHISDEKIRASAKELVHLLMELHGSGLERIMETVFAAGEPGAAIIDKLSREPLVSSLLVLHGLHPDDFETRVSSAVEALRPRLRKQDVEVELLEVSEAAVRVRVTPSAHACGSTTTTLRTSVEEAIYEAAPEVGSLVIEGLEGKSASGFVSLDTLVSGAMVVPSSNGHHASQKADG